MAYSIIGQTTKSRTFLKHVAKLEWSLDYADDMEKAWLALAHVHHQSSKNDNAEELLKLCVSYNRSCAKAFELMGNIYEQKQNYEQAVLNYREAWRLSGKTNTTIGYSLALANLKAKRYTEAIDICHIVLTEIPDYPKMKREILDKARACLRVTM
jgi:tetratricopeptide repeat protein 21B